MLYAYAFEYFRYKTIKPKPKRRVHYILFGWLTLISIWVMIRYSFVGIAGIFLVGTIYAWDRYMIDKMPGNN